MKETLSKGKMGKQVGKWGSKVEPTSWPATTLVGPPKVVPIHPSLLEAFWENIPKGDFPKISQKALSLFTTTFFSVWSNWKYSCGLKTYPVPTKIIFNAIRNNSGLVIFICEKHLKRFRQLRNISGFHPGKFQKVSRTILASSKNYQACAQTNLTLWYPLKQLFSFTETHPVTSLFGTFPLTETFPVSETFSVFFFLTLPV